MVSTLNKGLVNISVKVIEKLGMGKLWKGSNSLFAMFVKYISYSNLLLEWCGVSVRIVLCHLSIHLVDPVHTG